jgi:hypothetical protein
MKGKGKMWPEGRKWTKKKHNIKTKIILCLFLLSTNVDLHFFDGGNSATDDDHKKIGKEWKLESVSIAGGNKIFPPLPLPHSPLYDPQQICLN